MKPYPLKSRILYILVWSLSLLPLPLLYLLSSLLAPVIHRLVGYRKQVVYTNLRNAFPEKTARETELIARRFYLHFTDMFMETGKMLHWSNGSIMKRLRFRNEELLHQYISQGHTVIAAFGHYGNWEWLNAYNRLPGTPFLAVYKDLNDQVFNEMFYRLRSRMGTIPVPMKQTLRFIKKYEGQKKPSVFCFIADQCPVKEELEYWTRFLNQDTPVFLGIERLARRYNYPVVFIAIRKYRRGHYELELIDLCSNPSQSPPLAITERHVRELEKLIAEKPEYWMWTHRRWKFTRSDMPRKKSLYVSRAKNWETG